MGEIFKEFFDKAPDIIDKAAQSPLALASLIVLVLGIVEALLFRNVAGKLKLAAFAMITCGLLGLFIFASNPKPPRASRSRAITARKRRKSENKRQQNLPKENACALQDRMIRPARPMATQSPFLSGSMTASARPMCSPGLGDLERTLGRNDQARASYGEAFALYKREDNRLGQANVLRGLGDLDRMLGRHDQARAAYGDAIALYKQEGNRLGQANVLYGLGVLNSRKNPKQATRYFFEADQLYEMIGMTEAHDAALSEADKIYKR